MLVTLLSLSFDEDIIAESVDKSFAILVPPTFYPWKHRLGIVTEQMMGSWRVLGLTRLQASSRMWPPPRCVYVTPATNKYSSNNIWQNSSLHSRPRHQHPPWAKPLPCANHCPKHRRPLPWRQRAPPTVTVLHRLIRHPTNIKAVPVMQQHLNHPIFQHPKRKMSLKNPSCSSSSKNNLPRCKRNNRNLPPWTACGSPSHKNHCSFYLNYMEWL